MNQEDIRLDDLISIMEYNRIKAREERQKVQKHLEDIEKLREELMYKREPAGIRTAPDTAKGKRRGKGEY